MWKRLLGLFRRSLKRRRRRSQRSRSTGKRRRRPASPKRRRSPRKARRSRPSPKRTSSKKKRKHVRTGPRRARRKIRRVRRRSGRTPAKKRIKQAAKAPRPAATVTHYFPKVRAAVLACRRPLRIGDPIWIKGRMTDFRQTVGSLQIDRRPIETARPGQEVGLEVGREVRPGDEVFILKGA